MNDIIKNDKIEQILNNKKYIEMMMKIEELETDRVFCLHGVEHSLDVARIGYIMCLEQGLDIKKEHVYAAAFLHDIGRANEYAKKLPHHQQSAVIAEEILCECGFPEEDIDVICDAIRSHKYIDEEEKNLKYILYKADKLSRNCFACKMYHECYWTEDMKNHTIVI